MCGCVCVCACARVSACQEFLSIVPLFILFSHVHYTYTINIPCAPPCLTVVHDESARRECTARAGIN